MSHPWSSKAASVFLTLESSCFLYSVAFFAKRADLLAVLVCLLFPGLSEAADAAPSILGASLSSLYLAVEIPLSVSLLQVEIPSLAADSVLPVAEGVAAEAEGVLLGRAFGEVAAAEEQQDRKSAAVAEVFGKRARTCSSASARPADSAQLKISLARNTSIIVT